VGKGMSGSLIFMLMFPSLLSIIFVFFLLSLSGALVYTKRTLGIGVASTVMRGKYVRTHGLIRAASDGSSIRL
jgi:hypothetical protein